MKFFAMLALVACVTVVVVVADEKQPVSSPSKPNPNVVSRFWCFSKCKFASVVKPDHTLVAASVSFIAQLASFFLLKHEEKTKADPVVQTPESVNSQQDEGIPSVAATEQSLDDGEKADGKSGGKDVAATTEETNVEPDQAPVQHGRIRTALSKIPFTTITLFTVRAAILSFGPHLASRYFKEKRAMIYGTCAVILAVSIFCTPDKFTALLPLERRLAISEIMIAASSSLFVLVSTGIHPSKPCTTCTSCTDCPSSLEAAISDSSSSSSKSNSKYFLIGIIVFVVLLVAALIAMLLRRH